MPKIDTLKTIAGAHGGFANANRFTLDLSLPLGVLQALRKKNVAFDKQHIEMLCESVTIPGKQLESFDYSTYRNPIKMPNGYINDEVNISFLLTEDMFIKKIFDTWQEYILDPITYQLRYRKDYITDANIYTLDKKNVQKNRTRLVDCFPITVGGFEKSSESTDTLSKLQVTLACNNILRNEQI